MVFALPQEITDLIFSYFTLYKHRYRIRRVCKKWMIGAKITDFVIGYYLKRQIRQMAESFSKHPNLVGLSLLKDCEEFLRTEDLEPISMITNLSSLTIQQQPPDREDPRFISVLTNLAYLSVPTASPATLAPLTKLKYLNVRLANPSGFSESESYLRLPFLETATMLCASSRYPPVFLEQKLTKLTLNGVSEIPANNLDPYSKLKKLKIVAESRFINNVFSYLVELDANLPNLESLEALHTDIKNWTGLQSLTFLELEYNNIREISILTNLEKLTLRGINSYNQDLDLSPLKKLTAMQAWLARSASLKHTFDSINSDILQEINLYNPSTRDVPLLAKFDHLTSLVLVNFFDDEEFTCKIADLTILANLQTLMLDKCIELHMTGISKLGKLQHLTLSSCGVQNGSTELKLLPTLSELQLINCAMDIRGITTLKSLWIEETNYLPYNRADLSTLTSLRVYEDIPGIVEDILTWTSLQNLELGDIGEMSDIVPQLTTLKNLKRLHLMCSPWHESYNVLTRLTC